MPELNSAQRGHLRFVSRINEGAQSAPAAENDSVGRGPLTHSCDPFGRSDRIVSRQVTEHQSWVKGRR